MAFILVSMELLTKLQASLLDAICKNMLPSDFLEREVKHTVGHRIGKGEADNLRRDTINEFRATFMESMREILDKERVSLAASSVLVECQFASG